MIKLQVVNVNEREYTLKDENGKQYKHFLTFFDVDGGVVVGDTLNIHEELLNPKYEEYSKEYYFGPLNEVYGRAVKSAADLDVIAIEKASKTIVLKRFYG